MNDIAVSILVPVYNNELYLKRCLDSLINQTLKNIEIIVIDDGSTDSSSNIIKKYAVLDNRIIYLRKMNTGYGDTLNNGLNNAHGQYIGIVESDDFASLDMFEKLYNCAIEYNLDVVKSNYFLYWDDKDVKKNRFTFYVPTNKTIKDQQKEKLYFNAASIWSCIYRRSFLLNNSIRFLTTPGASYQDTGFNFKVLTMAKESFILPECLLYYRQDNNESSVKKSSFEKMMFVNEEYKEIEHFLKENNRWNEYYIKIYNTAKIKGILWNIGRSKKTERKKYIDFNRTWLNKILASNLYFKQYLTARQKIVLFLIDNKIDIVLELI